jgi:hypothetical protein
VDQIKKVVLEQRAVYGELAPYDYGTYTFLADYLPYVFGDGMEHRNSTVLTSSRGLKTNARGNLGHRSRTSSSIPGTSSGSGRRGLEPFNFRDANMTGELVARRGSDELLRSAGDGAGRAHALRRLRAGTVGECELGALRSLAGATTRRAR